MSWAGITLTIVLMVNLLLFLGCMRPEDCSGEVNSPMLGLLKGVITGNFAIDWGAFFTIAKLIQIVAIIGVVATVSLMLSPSTALTGSFATVHTLTIIGMALFISFFALPNFSALGIPEPVNSIISIIFGFMAVMSIMGFMRGE